MELSELSIPNLAMPKQGGGCTISRGNKCEKKKSWRKNDHLPARIRILKIYEN